MPIAGKIVALSRKLGGAMTAEDLADYSSEWVQPISTTYRGWTVYELPPNGQGIAALMMLNIMERFPLARYGHDSADALHVMIEAKKLAYADLLRYVGDPRFSHVPVAAMLSKRYAAARAALINMTRANCNVAPGKPTLATTGDTTYLTAVDSQGNMVSLIQSNYQEFGSRLVADHAGFVLQDRGALFNLDPASPDALAGHKRPLHTIIPGFMQRGEDRIAFGIMGGYNQAQAHAQFVSNVVDYGLDIQAAMEAPRFTKMTFNGCDVMMEDRIPEEVAQGAHRPRTCDRAAWRLLGGHGRRPGRDAGHRRPASTTAPPTRARTAKPSLSRGLSGRARQRHEISAASLGRDLAQGWAHHPDLPPGGGGVYPVRRAAGTQDGCRSCD